MIEGLYEHQSNKPYMKKSDMDDLLVLIDKIKISYNEAKQHDRLKFKDEPKIVELVVH